MDTLKRTFGPRLLARRVALRSWLRAPALRRHARRESARLAAETEPSARRLGEAMARVAGDTTDPALRRTLDRLEAGRRDMLHSEDVVTWSGGREEPVAWICARASQPPSGARMLHHLLAVWQPRRALELGTCVGISGGYQAAALPSGATLTTLEGYSGLARQAEGTWRGAGIDNAEVVVGTFAETLDGVLQQGPWGYAYIDGHHVGSATIDYVDRIAAVSEPGALLVLDDIDYNDGMREAWALVQERDDVVASTTLGKLGLLALR